jgi:hypothetical protein
LRQKSPPPSLTPFEATFYRDVIQKFKRAHSISIGAKTAASSGAPDQTGGVAFVAIQPA